MRNTKPRIAITIAPVVAALVLFAGPAPLAFARLFDINAQLRYDYRLTKERGMEAVGNGRFSTNYSLGIRRPLMPASTLLADVDLSAYSSNETANSQSSRTSALRLYVRKPMYDIIGRITRNDYRTEFGDSSSTGSSSGYNASLFLRQPAYPVVNIQYLRNISGSSFSGSNSSYAVNTWMLGAYHDLAPFRFSYDRTQQASSYSGVSGNQTATQRSSVSLERTLMSGLTLSGELSRYSMDLRTARGISPTTLTDRGLIRLTMTPTPAVAASVDYSLQSNYRRPQGTVSDTDVRSLTTSVRAEVLPGLSLDYTRGNQSQTGGGGIVGGNLTSGESRIALNARLGDQASVSGSTSHSKYDTGTAGSNTSNSSQQLAFQTALSRTTDFSTSLQRNLTALGLGSQYNSTFVGASLRNRTTQNLSLGLAYRRSNVESLSDVGQALTIHSNSADLDMLWLATNSLGIDLKLSWHADSGSTGSRRLSPSYNVRWQLAPTTNFSLNYDLQTSQQRDLTGLWLPGFDSRNVSLHVTHGFRSGSSLGLSYDFSGASIGSTEWQKLIRASFTTRL